MILQTCQAPNLAALMEKIKATYGSNAALLSVRRLNAPGGDSRSPVMIEGTIAFEGNAPGELPTSGASGVPSAIAALRRHAIAPPRPPENAAAPVRRVWDAKAFALVGPMGAGKTTTAAKLAGRLLRHTRKPVGVISTDVQRPGGSALLAAYAERMQLFATTAASASDLQDRFTRWSCRGPLVVDTRGCSPRDDGALTKLGTLLDGVKSPMERLLVLSATEHRSVARECLRSYEAVGYSGVVLTRVDQAAGVGDCLDEVRKHRKEVVLAGTGERVPDDLMDSTKTALLALENAY